jgi:hypothetical protein
MELTIKKSNLSLITGWIVVAIIGRAVSSFAAPYLSGKVVFEILFIGLRFALLQWLLLQLFTKNATKWALITFVVAIINSFFLEFLDVNMTFLLKQFYTDSVLFPYIFFSTLQAAQGLIFGGFQSLALLKTYDKAVNWIYYSVFAFFFGSLINIAILNYWGTLETVPAMQISVRPYLIVVIQATITGFGLAKILFSSQELDESEEEFKSEIEEIK